MDGVNRYGHLLGAVPATGTRRRSPMDVVEVREALALKARHRCGWQVVADMLGRPVADVQKACAGGAPPLIVAVPHDPVGLAAPSRAAPPTPSAPPPTPLPALTITARRAAALASASIDDLPLERSVLEGLRALNALPGFCPRAAYEIGKVSDLTASRVGHVLRALALLRPALVSRGEGEAARLWRLTDAGLATLKGWRS